MKFFRLIQEKATYLQACILLRYFNDVRARALARIVKAYAPRGGSRYPAEDLMNTLAFESVESMKSFVNHYGLRFSKTDTEITVILNRNNFIEDSDPYPLSRAVDLIESKRQCTVGEVVAGGQLPPYKPGHDLYSSFNSDGSLKERALIAEDLGYNTINDSNKDVRGLKLELQKLLQGRSFEHVERVSEKPKNVQVEVKSREINKSTKHTIEPPVNKLFSFQPAIPVAPPEIIKISPEKLLQESSKNVFTFSKPKETVANVFSKDLAGNLFSTKIKPFAESKIHSDVKKVFANAGQGGSGSNEPVNVFKNASIGKSIFGQQNVQEAKAGKEKDINIFASTNKKLFQADGTSNNIFSKAGNNLFSNSQSIFKAENINKNISNGGTAAMSPSSLFKSANKPSFETTMFQSKMKAPTVADNIFNSFQSKHDVYDFASNDNDNDVQPIVGEQEYLEEERKRQEEQKRQEEEKRRQEEERKRQEEIKRLELKRKEEEKRKQEALRQEELRKIEEKRRKEEQKRQEELRKKLEEERKLELKRQAQEQERLFREKVDKESSELIDELVNEISDEAINVLLNEEIERLRKLVSFAKEVTEDIYAELTEEICESEMKAEMFRTRKLAKKWYRVWRNQFIRNFKRRSLLEDTPVWLAHNTPLVEARYLRRATEDAALRNMNAIHRGYRFVGELKPIPSTSPYNIVDLIRSPLLKRMRVIEHPYGKCLFWKVALVTPSTKWIYRKINIEDWVNDAFSDNKRHEVSETLIHVSKDSWNNLMDIAVSVSVIKSKDFSVANEALNGANGVIFYATENDNNLIQTIEQTLIHKYQYQVVPITIVMAETNDPLQQQYLNERLTYLKSKNIISDYRLYTVEQSNNSINTCTKSALKWLAKNYPKPPSLEIDSLKSICQRYLGNEIWDKLKSEKDRRTESLLKSLHQLVSCYNIAVDKLTQVITNEDLFNYPSFPLEFHQYLDNMSPYPKPYEFIPSNVKQSDNVSAIKRIMQKLKLPNPSSDFLPKSISNMQDQMRKYCYEIGWFSDPEEVVCKVVALLPNELSDTTMANDQFSRYYLNYDLIDLLNVIVCEKIIGLGDFENRLAIYEKPVLEEYRNAHWLFEIEVYSKAKHKVLEYEDELDYFVEAKRRRLYSDSYEYLMLEDKDCTMVEESIQRADKNISAFDSCQEAVSQLEEQLNEEKKKSEQLENLLRAALSNV